MSEWYSVWVGDLKVAGSNRIDETFKYAIGYREEGEVIVREGNTKRGKIVMKIADKTPSMLSEEKIATLRRLANHDYNKKE